MPRRSRRPRSIRRWAARQPDLAAARKAARRGAEVVGGLVKRKTVYTRDSGICHLCGGPVSPTNWHMDHIIPIAKGGTHSYDNVAVSHPYCNLRKGVKLLG